MEEAFSVYLLKYRTKHGLTKADMGDRMGISERMYAYYEKGEYDGSPSKVKKYRDLLGNFQEGGDKKKKTGKGDLTPIKLTAGNFLWAPLVRQYAQAGYLNGYGDAEYLESLPTVPFPIDDREYKGNYVAFEVRGDSMVDGTLASICERDIVLGREISPDLWKSKLHIHKWNFIIVTKDDGIIFKQITQHNVTTGEVTIHSLNPLYADRKMNLKNVSRLFNVVKIMRNT